MQQIWVKEFFVTLAKTNEEIKSGKYYFEIARPFLLELKPVSDIIFNQRKFSKEWFLDTRVSLAPTHVCLG